VVLVVSVAGTLAIAVGDFLTGPYLVWATFYLVPVVATAWFVGRAPALLVGALAAVVGVVSTALDPQDVTPAVYAWNGIFRFVTYAFIAGLVAAERRAVETVSTLSATDPLTGLANRRRFYDEVELVLARAARSGEPFALAYLDIDDLKVRNDSGGHEAGDDMLVTVAELAVATVRAGDLVARLGGDEFCILLPGLDLPAAEAVVARLTAALAAAATPIRFSAGLVAGTVPADGVDADEVVRAADALMYEAKQAGKGQLAARPLLLEG
jgi:diguanylate cyclase (GGDEF)-like protein